MSDTLLLFMAAQGFTLFKTPIGECGIAWTEQGVACVQLPEGSAQATAARLLERAPGGRKQAPPANICAVRDALLQLLQGRHVDLSWIVLDLASVPPFHGKVYSVARRIPVGATRSYGEIAVELGVPGGARAVGQALGRNPFALVVPCHRVLAAGGKMGGFSADGGVSTKQRLLQIEGYSPEAERKPQRAKRVAQGNLSQQVNSAPQVEPAPKAARRAWPEPRAAAQSGFSFDPELAVCTLRDKDARLARLIDAVGPFTMQLNHTQSLFSALTESIVYQQLTGKAAGTIHARLCALFPTSSGPTPSGLSELDDAALRAVGLSRAKALALKDLAQRTLAGQLPSLQQAAELSDAALIAQLTQVRGVGPWTVQMLLMFRLGRPDVLPVADYGVRKGYALTFKRRELPSAQQLEKHAERWRPFRSVASWYLWRALDLAKA